MGAAQSYTLLLVDDDTLILDVLRIQLEHFLPEFITIERANSGEEALSLMKELSQHQSYVEENPLDRTGRRSDGQQDSGRDQSISLYDQALEQRGNAEHHS